MSYDSFGSLFSNFDDTSLNYLMRFGLAIVGVVLTVVLLSLTLAIVLYVFRSVGLYTIAKRRGIHNPWMAWIPILQNWIVGCISDQYQYVVKGRICNKRKIMLGLSIGQIVLNTAISVVGSRVIRMSRHGSANMISSAVIGLNLLNVCLSVTLFVFVCMALYDLYTSSTPQNNVTFLVLGILFPITIPFFVFCNRKKDYGMPPRVQQPPAYQQENWFNP